MASLWETYIDPDVDNRTEAIHALCDEIDRRLTELEIQKKEVIPSHEWMRKLEERIKALEDQREAYLEFIVTQILLNKKVNESLSALEQSRPEPTEAGEGWRKWNLNRVWRWNIATESAQLLPCEELESGDLWQPYDPAHPEPPSAPKEGAK